MIGGKGIWERHTLTGEHGPEWDGVDVLYNSVLGESKQAGELWRISYYPDTKEIFWKNTVTGEIKETEEDPNGQWKTVRDKLHVGSSIVLLLQDSNG